MFNTPPFHSLSPHLLKMLHQSLSYVDSLERCPKQCEMLKTQGPCDLNVEQVMFLAQISLRTPVSNKQSIFSGSVPSSFLTSAMNNIDHLLNQGWCNSPGHHGLGLTTFYIFLVHAQSIRTDHKIKHGAAEFPDISSKPHTPTHLNFPKRVRKTNSSEVKLPVSLVFKVALVALLRTR